MKIVVLDGYLANFDRMPWRVQERFGAEVEWYDHTPPERILERIREADAVFVNRAMLGREILEACPRLKFIGVFGTGYNILNLNVADRLGITVCNVPDYSSHAVAQHTAALLLETTNRVGEFSALLKGDGWKQAADPAVTAIPMTELYGKTVGIYGYGAIGQAFGKICRAMGMRVLAYRRNPNPEDGVIFVDAPTLRRESDVLSLHCPLTEQTRGLVEEHFLAEMKPGAILLNTARGAILREEAVVQALDNGQLSAAGVDVFAQEPAGGDHPLVRHPKCVVTPHVSWSPRETRQRLLEICAQNLEAYLESTPQNVVNNPFR